MKLSTTQNEFNPVPLNLFWRKPPIVEIFKLNVELYPDAFNTYDSLGEAYMTAGNNELARINYEKSYELYPKNENAKKMAEKLR